MRISKGASALFLMAAMSSAQATTIYNEALNGDLSNVFSSPTTIAAPLGIGSNQFFGATGRAAPVPPATTGVIDRDYLTFTIPAGLHLVAIEVLPGTQSDTTAPLVSFIGLKSGSQGSDPSTTPSSALAQTLLGYYLYGPANIGNDILAGMAANNLFTGAPFNQPPAQGFSAPLGAGTYTLWMQETVVGNFNYGFDLKVVPEPETLPLFAAGLAGFAFARRKPA